MRRQDSVHIGIQGAARESRLAACTADGEIIGTIRTGPLALRVNHDLRSEFRDALTALAIACERSSIRQMAADCAGLCVAMSGVYQDGDFFAIRQLLADVGFIGDFEPLVCEDIWADMAAAGFDRGVVLLSSTGSNFVAGQLGGRSINVGGWGSEIDDPGSGYSIGIAALRAILSAEDGRADVSDDFRRAVLERLRLTTVPQVVPWYQAVRRTDYWRSKIADLAIPITRLQQLDADATAIRILQQGADELACALRVGLERAFNEQVISPLSKQVLLVTGGLATNSLLYWNTFERETAAFSNAHPDTAVTPQKAIYHPVVGSLALACAGSLSLPDRQTLDQLWRSAQTHPKCKL